MKQLFEEMKKLILKQNDDEFEFFIQNHQELLKLDPVLFISNHVSYYAYKEDINKVLEVINYYKNAPYISMTVEDLLNELKDNVERLKMPQKSLNNDEVKTLLLSKNEEKIASCFDYLSKVNIRLFLTDIQEFLLQEIPYKYKTLALFILIEQRIDLDFKLSKKGLIYTINPNLLELPFETYEYQETKRLIEEDDLDPQVRDYAIEIMNACQIKEFPDSYLTLDTSELMKDVFILIAKKMLCVDYDVNNVAVKHQINDAKILEMINELNQVLLG